MNNIEMALKSMGYRQPDPAKTKRWCKPIGFTMINCDVDGDKAIMVQWMMATPSKPELLCWTQKEFQLSLKTVDELAEEICSFEGYSLKDSTPPILQKFAFLTKTEQIECAAGL